MELPGEFILSEQPIQDNEIQVFTFDEFDARYADNPIVIYGNVLISRNDGTYYVDMDFFSEKHLNRAEFDRLRNASEYGFAHYDREYPYSTNNGPVYVRWLYGENFMILDDIVTKTYLHARGLE